MSRFIAALVAAACLFGLGSVPSSADAGGQIQIKGVHDRCC